LEQSDGLFLLVGVNMKVTHENTTIEIQDDERLMLKQILSIVEDLGNDAVRRNGLCAVLAKAGLMEPREAGQLRDFAEHLNEEL